LYGILSPIQVEVLPVVVSAPNSGATFGLLALSGLGLLLARRRRNA
jgi:MYXO-CTERM domain-containing protein